MKKVLKFFAAGVASTVIAACVPSDIQAACKRKAIQSGYGKCSVSKGRQNAYRVWIVQMDCSAGLASCSNNTAERVSVSDWTSMSEHLHSGG